MSTDSNHTVELGQVKSSKCYINIDYILQDQKISFEVFKSSLDTNCVLFKRNIPLDKMYQSKSCTQIKSNSRVTYLKVDKMIQTEGRSWLSPFLSPDNLGPPPFYRSRSPNANKNYENPVRDKPQQKATQAYKENYEVSKFKFPERTPVTRNNHANFCELNFDGTKPKKQKHVLHRHNKTQLNVKKVTSDTKLNYLTTISLQNKQQQEEFSKRIRDKLDRYCAKHHKKVNVNNQDATFDELAAEITKKSVPSSRPKSRRKEKTAFELVLSTKGEKIEKPSKEPSKNTSPRRKPKKIIVTSTTLEPIGTYVHKYNLKSTDTKLAEKQPVKLERSESLNELFVKQNFRRPSTDKFCHEEMDHQPHHHKKKKRKKHLTMTVFPCLEIKCSSKHLEMPVEQIVRPKMPRRTITPEENKILKNSVKEKLTLNDEERKNLIETRILQSSPEKEHRILKSQPNMVLTCQDQLPMHLGFVTTCNNPSQPSFESTFDQNNANIPSQQLSFVSASNEENFNNAETTNDNIKHKLTNILTKNKTEDYSKKIEDLCTLIGNLITQQPDKTVKRLHRSRSVTPEREKSRPTSDSVKKNSEKSTEIQDMFSTSKIFNTSTISFPTATDSINSYPMKPKNLQIIHNQNQVVTISEDTSKYTLCDNCESKDIKKSSEKIKTVPKNVFVIPSHVNKILKQYDMKKTAKSATVSINGSDDQTGDKQKEKYNSVSIETSNSKPPDLINYKLAEIAKKPSIKQKLGKSSKKSELILPKKPLQSGISKMAKDENSYSTVTFNSHVDIYENYRDTKPFQMGDEINVKNTLINVSSKTTIKRSKTLPSKQEFYKKNDLNSPESTDTYDSKHSRNSNQGFQSDTKRRPGSILNSTFLSSKKEIANPNNTFQKRKEYYNKLKMQMKKPNESDLDKNTEYETSPPKSSRSSIRKQNSIGTSNHSSVSENTVMKLRVIKTPLNRKNISPQTKNKALNSRIPKLTARSTKTSLSPNVFPQKKLEAPDENQPKTFLKLFPVDEPESTRDVTAPVTSTQHAKNYTQTFENKTNTYFNSASYKILSRNSTILATERRRRFLKKNHEAFAQRSQVKNSDRHILYTILNSYPARPHIDVYLDEIKEQGYLEHTVMCAKRHDSEIKPKKQNKDVHNPEDKKVKKNVKDHETPKNKQTNETEKPHSSKNIGSPKKKKKYKTTRKVSFHDEKDKNKKQICNCNGFFCKCCKPNEVDDSNSNFKFSDPKKTHLYPALIEPSNVFQSSIEQNFSEMLSSDEVVNTSDDLLLSLKKVDSMLLKKSKNTFTKTVNRVHHFFRRKTSDMMRIVTRKKQDNG